VIRRAFSLKQELDLKLLLKLKMGLRKLGENTQALFMWLRIGTSVGFL
jgi:hypothetical protein